MARKATIILAAAVMGDRDKLYCGEGTDHYLAKEADYVDSSCEKKARVIAIS